MTFFRRVGGNYDDWFELYNPGPDAADLAGCSLTDNLANPFQSPVPAGYLIAPGGYLLVWADGQASRNSTNSPDLHVNFQLAKSGEAIGLFASDGRLIDAVTFGPQTNNISQGRFPDGTPDLHFMSTPTPRAPNVLAGVTNAIAFTNLGRLPNGDVALTWRTIIGRSYRAEFKNDLNEPQWSSLGDYLASGPSLTILDPLGASPQRFYRVRQLE